MRITSKGQVPIPLAVRKALGLLPNTEVSIVVDGASARLVKVATASRRGRAVVDALRGKADKRMTTDEIMALTRGRRS